MKTKRDKRPFFSLNIRIFKLIQKQKGTISIFLSGLLVISLFASGMLIDYSRIATAKAELRSALQMSSHTMLSAFDKKIANEFGLFVLAQDFDMEETNNFLEERLEGADSRTGSFGIRLINNKVSPLNDQRLSLPPVLERQIVQMMEWQIARILFSKIGENYKLLDAMKKYSAVFRSKLEYEKHLQGLQKLLTKMSKGIESLAGLKSQADKIYRGVGSLKENIDELKETKLTLYEDLLTALEEGIDRAEEEGLEEENLGNLISNSDRSTLLQSFQTMMNSYYNCRDNLREEKKLMNSLISTGAETGGAFNNSKEKAGAWKENLDGLEKGAMTQGLYSDYFSKILVQDSGSFDKFSEELTALGKKVVLRQESWEKISLGKLNLNNLRFSQWLENTLEKVQFDNNSILIKKDDIAIQSPDLLLSEEIMSEEALKFQENLHRQAEADRSGLMEFISAWTKQKELIKNAKQAQKLNLSNLQGGVGSLLSESILAAYDQDALGYKQDSMDLPSPGSDMGAAEGSFNLIDSFLSVISIFDSDAGDFTGLDKDYLSVLSYWAKMFSHKQTAMDDKKRGEDSKSLTGFLLKDRPAYGAELEYILLGRPLWFDNHFGIEIKISALRLLFNLVHAFSSSSLYAQTSSLAMALAGWSGFGVAFVQSALLITLSIGETAYDLKRLNEGEKIPLMKNDDNWVFSLTGIKELSRHFSKDIFDYIELEISSGLEAGGQMAKESLDGLASNLKDRLDSSVRQPIFRISEEIIRSSKIYSRQDLDRIVSDFLDGIDQTANRTGSGYNAGALQKVRASKNTLISIIEKALAERDLAGPETNEPISNLQANLNQYIDSINSDLSSQVDSFVGAVEKDLSGLKDMAAEKADEKLQAIFKNFDGHLAGGQALTSNAIGGAINMSYADYINFFLFLFSMTKSGKEGMLSNTARLVHAETLTTDLTKSAVEYEWETEISIPVLFLPKFSSTGLELDGKRIRLEERWREGYGKRKAGP